jgi:hypothetical protein
LSLLNHTVILKIFGKPPLPWCLRNISLPCYPDCSSVASFVRVWCDCSLFWDININLVAVTRKPAVFSQSILWTVPTHTPEVASHWAIIHVQNCGVAPASPT